METMGMKRRELLKNIGIGVGVVLVAPVALASTFTKPETTIVSGSLDHTSTSELLLNIKLKIEAIIRQHIFEVNDVLTRDSIYAESRWILTELVERKIVYDYRVICDETNNTPNRIDNGELYVDIVIQKDAASNYMYLPVRVVYDDGSIFNPRSTRKNYWFANAGTNGNFGNKSLRLMD